MDDLVIFPFGCVHLLQPDRLTIGCDEFHDAFVKGGIVSDSGRHHMEPFPVLDSAQKLLLALDVGRQPFCWLALSCMTVSAS